MTTTRPGPEAGSADADGPEPVPLLVPGEGVPPVVETAAALDEVVARFAAASGPVAVDAERASGYRYSQRAYLVQLRRRGAGTALVDPIACPDLSPLSEVLQDDAWVLHAASQDLPCLAEVGMEPPRVFDTELAGRLAGFERVGLGAMVEQVLGLRLEKGHSAADWSTRPLPQEWLVYAALDVEVLLDLRDALEEELRAQGKLDWALEEFEAVRLAPPPGPRADPWRRTSGIHRLRTRRQLAGVRELWLARDAMARRRDTAPGRVLPDAAIVAAVQAAPQTAEDLVKLPVFGGRSTRRHAGTWFAALRTAATLPDAELPVPAPAGDGPPPANRWAERDPVAARRLARARAAVAALAEELRMPPENLVQPEAVRRLAWTPPVPAAEEAVDAALAASGVRDWQRRLVTGPLAAVLPDPPEDAADQEPAARPARERSGERGRGRRTRPVAEHDGAADEGPTAEPADAPASAATPRRRRRSTRPSGGPADPAPAVADAPTGRDEAGAPAEAPARRRRRSTRPAGA